MMNSSYSLLDKTGLKCAFYVNVCMYMCVYICMYTLHIYIHIMCAHTHKYGCLWDWLT